MDQLFGQIHSIETMGMVDGPGIRYVIFFQGCNLRCLYCHNPDTWQMNCGRRVTVDELTEDILRYEPFFRHSGGGVTASGGDPILQLEFTTRLFAKLKEKGIHTALDTAGNISFSEKVDQLIQVTDLVLFDIKHIENSKHKILTGIPNKRPLDFLLEVAKSETEIWIRQVILPGYTDDEEMLNNLRSFLRKIPHITRLELLPYHNMGIQKYEELQIPYSLHDVEPPSRKKMEEIKAQFVNEPYKVIYSGE